MSEERTNARRSIEAIRAVQNRTFVEAPRGPALLGRREVLKAGVVAALASLVTGEALAGQVTPRPSRTSRAASTSDHEREHHMDIQRVGTKASVEGPSDWFTGKVRIDAMFDTKEPSQVGSACVTFEPGARTAWHTHPLGQHIVITSGVGWVQEEGGKIEEVRPGDIVWFPPNVKHWHGASPNNAMTHIAVQEAKDGKVVDWMEKVSDKQYQR